MAACADLQDLELEPIPEGGCVDCLAIGGRWVHLRYCVTCKMIRCCDDSPNQHSRKHWRADGHGVIRSAEANERWAWCYDHDEGIRT